MIYRETMLNVADNSGATLVKCIGIPGGSKKRCAYVGEEIMCAVKVAKPTGKIKKGDMIRAVVVRTKAFINRSDGSKIKFSDNSVVLLDSAGKNFSYTRVFGAIAREVQNSKAVKALSIAKEVI